MDTASADVGKKLDRALSLLREAYDVLDAYADGTPDSSPSARKAARLLTPIADLLEAEGRS